MIKEEGRKGTAVTISSYYSFKILFFEGKVVKSMYLEESAEFLGFFIYNKSINSVIIYTFASSDDLISSFLIG